MIADAGTSRRWTGRARALPSATFGTTSTAAPRTALHLGGPGSCDGEHASKGRAPHGAVTKQRPKVCNADRCSPAVTAGVTAHWGAHSPNALHAARGGTWDGTDLRMGMPSALMITYPMNPGIRTQPFHGLFNLGLPRSRHVRCSRCAPGAHGSGQDWRLHTWMGRTTCPAIFQPPPGVQPSPRRPQPNRFCKQLLLKKKKHLVDGLSKFVTHSCPSTQFASVLAGGGCRHAPAPCAGRTQPHGPTISL